MKIVREFVEIGFSEIGLIKEYVSEYQLLCERNLSVSREDNFDPLLYLKYLDKGIGNKY